MKRRLVAETTGVSMTVTNLKSSLTNALEARIGSDVSRRKAVEGSSAVFKFFTSALPQV